MSTEKTIAPDEFSLLLRAFNKLVEGNSKADQISQELEDLKASAETSVELNARQKDAILGRCNNYLNGSYGNTKRPEHFEQSKPSK